MCTKTQLLLASQGLKRHKAFIYYNVYQNALHLASQGFGQTSGIQFLQCVSECITLGKSRFWPDFRHSSLAKCTRTHCTWRVKILVKTSGIHLLQCTPERITLGESRFWLRPQAFIYYIEDLKRVVISYEIY